MKETTLLENFFQEERIALWGICSLERPELREEIPKELYGRFKTAIVFAFPLSSAIVDSLSDGPNLIYLHHYRQVNYLLDRTGLLLSNLLQENGFLGFSVPASQIIDWEKEKGLLSHKRLALAAGIGWRGRNNLLVTKSYGSRIRLATVLTDASFLETPGFSGGCEGCQDCFACLSRCPVNAIKKSPEEFDYQACHHFIKEICRKKNIGQNICGLCLCSPAWKKKKRWGYLKNPSLSVSL